LTRTTFLSGQHVFEPEHFGVASRVSTLVVLAKTDNKDPLDDYVEAHVHGPVELARDVEALVVHHCYRGTSVKIAPDGWCVRSNGMVASSTPPTSPVGNSPWPI
jgi:hypothetical protein